MADTKSIMTQLGGQGEIKAQGRALPQESAGSPDHENREIGEESDVPVPDYTDALMASLKKKKKKKETIR